MTACLCSHAPSSHAHGTGQCWSVVCGCSAYRRPQAPEPTPEEQAVIDRFENTRPAPESYRPEEDDL